MLSKLVSYRVKMTAPPKLPLKPVVPVETAIDRANIDHSYCCLFTQNQPKKYT